MANRKRPIILRCPVTAEERSLIEQKMAQLQTKRIGAYLRKMAIDGYIIQVDTRDINLTSLRRSGKVFVFGKNSILCPLASPCGKTYGHLICISYMKKYLRFLTPFNTVFRVLDGK